MADQFYTNPKLPFVECRYSTNSGRSYKPHMHKAFSIGAIDQGEVIYQVGAHRATLRPGSLALVNPETLHSCNPTEFSKRSYYMLFLDVEWCLLLQQSLWRVTAYRPVKRILLEDERLYQQCIDMLRFFLDDGDLLEKEQLLVELVETVFLRACEPTTAPTESAAHLAQIKRQLGTRLDADISMRQIAAELRANPYTLLRQFKTATGITPHAYRLNCKIEYAKTLMRQGRHLAQVALECGFFDQSHFHRHFKAITAVTPREYQRNFLP